MEFNDWQHFTEGPRRKRRDGLHVTLSRRGHIFLSRPAHEAIGGSETAELFFDARNKAIGIKAAEPKSTTSFRLIRKYETTGGRALYVSNFFQHYRIRIKETYFFPTARVTDDGILILSLREMLPIKKS